MIRLLSFLIILAPFTWGALWLADHPGHVVMQWFGYQIETTLSLLIAAVVIAVMSIIATVLVLRGLLTLPARLRGKNRIKRQEHGLEALTQVLTSMAIADYRTANKQLKRAKQYLGNAPSVNLLSAQLAHAQGDRNTALDCFDALMDSSTTRQVALRGKIEQAVRDGKHDQAIEYAQEAWKKQPTDRWLALVLIDLYTRSEQWLEALQMVQQAYRNDALSKEDRNRYEAILLFERAKAAMEDGKNEKAFEKLSEARRRDGNFAPAQKLAVEIAAGKSDKKAAFKLIQHLWKTTPQAAYVDTLLHLFSDEPAAKLQKRFERLITNNPDDLESQIAMARCAVHIGKWDLARNYLKIAMTKQESPRIYQLMAQIEKGELNDDKQANEWLKRAVNAPKDPRWHCTRCGDNSDEWSLHCPECNSFDSYVWQAGNVATEDEGEMLIAESAA